MMRTALLRVPPFPNARIVPLAIPCAVACEDHTVDAEEAVVAMRRARVGGTFWGAQPALPTGITILAIPKSAAQFRAMTCAAISAGAIAQTLFWLPRNRRLRTKKRVLIGLCDPWHLFDQVDQVWADAADDHLLLARIAGKSVQGFGAGAYAGSAADWPLLPAVHQALWARCRYSNPFTQAEMTLAEALALLSHWRTLIDSNRTLAAGFGFARWKQQTVAALLWDGSARRFFRKANIAVLAHVPAAARLAIWKSRVPPAFLTHLSSTAQSLVEVEDGFIRSAGLGANCVPPLSIVVDSQGIYFDPSQPSDLENLILKGDFSPALLQRAATLRAIITDQAISKYAVGGAALVRPGGGRQHILVTGQVEDDRSIAAGASAIRTNLGLLQAVRKAAPQAYILYKPHPDVEAGHRIGHIPDADARAFADAIVREQGIAPLLDMVDEVHVMTSLAGFEGLLRGKKVVTYGAPFYAGWGLTEDRGSVPARRAVMRALDELVAATYLLYPRYLDPLTGLPCPAEVLLTRLTQGIRAENKAVVTFRRMQGQFMRLWRRA